MTNITPQQMRELADRAGEAGSYEVMETGIVDELATNLRAAAEQLEAVQGWADHADPVYADLSGLYAILTADTAPQEGRDE